MTTPRYRATLLYLGLSIVTIAIGLVLRLVSFGLPFAVVKWGGSVLWAAMVYWISAAILPLNHARTAAIFASVFAILVEFSRLYHSPALDTFRTSLAGTLLLGHVFTWWHIAIYVTTIVLAAWVDRRWIRRSDRRELDP